MNRPSTIIRTSHNVDYQSTTISCHAHLFSALSGKSDFEYNEDMIQGIVFPKKERKIETYNIAITLPENCYDIEFVSVHSYVKDLASNNEVAWMVVLRDSEFDNLPVYLNEKYIASDTFHSATKTVEFLPNRRLKSNNVIEVTVARLVSSQDDKYPYSVIFRGLTLGCTIAIENNIEITEGE